MVDVSAPVRDYMAAMTALPAWQEWRRAGVAETWRIEHDEVD
jgi:glutathione S-transferase